MVVTRLSYFFEYCVAFGTLRLLLSANSRIFQYIKRGRGSSCHILFVISTKQPSQVIKKETLHPVPEV